MRALRLSLFLGLALIAASCGKQHAADQRSAASAARTSAAAAAQAKPAVATPQSAVAAATKSTSKATRLNEDGSEQVDDTSTDSGAHNPLLAAVASTVAAATTAANAAPLGAPTPWQEGTNYTRLVPAQPTSVPTGQVEVLEFFWYACPHCYALDSMVESWKKTKAPYITFARVHVMWNQGHRALARLYYTLDGMGKLEQLHGEVFKEIHVNGNPLVGGSDAESERIQTAFVKKFGISEGDFQTAYHSIGVETALQRADLLVQRYRVDAVPTFVVNGKYVADVRSAEGPERLMSLVNDLAAQEHKH